VLLLLPLLLLLLLHPILAAISFAAAAGFVFFPGAGAREKGLFLVEYVVLCMLW
jgi:hypothetical protein